MCDSNRRIALARARLESVPDALSACPWAVDIAGGHGSLASSTNWLCDPYNAHLDQSITGVDKFLLIPSLLLCILLEHLDDTLK